MASTIDSDDDNDDDYNDRGVDQEPPMYVAEAVAAANKNAHMANANAAAASSGVKSSSSPSLLAQQEAWMINLGRDDNDQWLTGPRDPNEWFTGVQPSECPGVEKVVSQLKGDKERHILRSLPLPRLDNVTRQNVKEYFDNSWTLYETLFAGLNGEEYFYRYVRTLVWFGLVCSFVVGCC